MRLFENKFSLGLLKNTNLNEKINLNIVYRIFFSE